MTSPTVTLNDPNAPDAQKAASATTGQISPPTQTGPGVRRFGAVNWLGLRTFFFKEVHRFIKVAFQTVLAPVITTLLYMAVFAIAFGATRNPVNGVDYIVFLVPGLVMMAILNNAFANSSSSLIIGKLQGSIVDILMAPLSAAEMTTGLVAGAAVRGLIVGLVTALTAAIYMFFNAGLPVENIFAIFYFGLSAAIMFATLGVIGGIWAEKFDQLAAISNFIIQPLTFLSGTFYPISRLPEPFLSICSVNPIFMLVDGFRYGFIGTSEVSVTTSAITVLILNIVLIFAAYRLLKSGWKIKS